MGLTHYWKRSPELAAEPFGRVVDDCRLVLGRVGVVLAGPDGSGPAVIDAEAIRFNGMAPAACESFLVSRIQRDRVRDGMARSFCKTGGLPYDLCVKLSLIILRHHHGGAIVVASDENSQAWDAARAICSEHVGYGDDFELSNW